MKHNFKIYARETCLPALFGSALLIIVSCKKEWKPELEGEAPRLFRPVMKGGLSSVGNYVTIAWQNSLETNKYKAELSVDSFKTVSNSAEVSDTTGVVITNLLWEQLYLVRVTALHPTDPSKNSRPADFGSFTTPSPTSLNK